MRVQNELATEITLVWKKKLAVQALWFYVLRALQRAQDPGGAQLRRKCPIFLMSFGYVVHRNSYTPGAGIDGV